ncbi:flagellar biosynthesis regulator FlaF [Yunchengibacter salinarum]|uniref:flagellar biosynthesis regulator FlaF n=1 Tax=Yunchengibacter salinarum TaxID=3133399 RepID=UPI0035B62A16
MSYQAYQQAQQSSETPSQTEYRLMAKVTRALMDAQPKGSRHPETVKALDWNRRMWSTFSSDCGAKGNGLPPQLRASIISLAIWVSKHTSKVIRGQETLDELISVNKTVMEGLAMQARNAGGQQARPTPPPAGGTGAYGGTTPTGGGTEARTNQQSGNSSGGEKPGSGPQGTPGKINSLL